MLLCIWMPRNELKKKKKKKGIDLMLIGRGWVTLYMFYSCPVSPRWVRILNTSPVSSCASHLHLISV